MNIITDSNLPRTSNKRPLSTFRLGECVWNTMAGLCMVCKTDAGDRIAMNLALGRQSFCEDATEFVPVNAELRYNPNDTV